jgi:hypothetical protein
MAFMELYFAFADSKTTKAAANVTSVVLAAVLVAAVAAMAVPDVSATVPSVSAS